MRARALESAARAIEISEKQAASKMNGECQEFQTEIDAHDFFLFKMMTKPIMVSKMLYFSDQSFFLSARYRRGNQKPPTPRPQPLRNKVSFKFWYCRCERVYMHAHNRRGDAEGNS